jgi:hypothetical protein
MTTQRLEDGCLEREAFEAWWDAEEDPANWPKNTNWSSQKIHAYMAWQARAALSSASKQAGWISVDERLPEHEQEVICTGFVNDDPTHKRWQEFAVFHRDGLFYNRDTGDDYYPPTHWRELLEFPAAPTQAQGESHE